MEFCRGPRWDSALEFLKGTGFRFKLAAAGLCFFLMFIAAASAQIGGTGWKPQTLNFKIQWPTNAAESTRYFITNSPLPTYRCLVYSNDGAFSIGNTTRPRTEQRFNPDYTNGEIQHQVTLMCPSNENSYCPFQIHTGDAQSPTYGSTIFMLFWFSSDGGSVHDYSGTELAGNLGNKWFQLNVDHNMVTGTIRVWVNQKLVWTQQDNGAGDYYFKDGVYEQDHGPSLVMETYITNVLEWTSSGTNPPAAPTSLVATSTLSQINLTWNSSVAATNYNLKRSTTSGGPYTNIATLTGTSYPDTTVSNGPTYYYVVSALDQFGESSNSSPASASLVRLGFQLSASPLSATIAAGASTNYLLTVTTNSSFTGTMSFGIAGLPGGATASFSPPTLTTNGISTLTVQTTTNTPGGNYPLILSATNGSTIFTTNVTLAINGIAAFPGTLFWSGGGTGTNWSTVFNWTNMTAGGYGPPGLANTLVFSNTAAVSSGTANNVVDGNFSVASLQYANNAASSSPNYHVTLINSGQTLVVTNGLVVGTAADSGASQVVNAVVTGANGTLVLSNGVLAFTQGSGSDGAHQAVLDLSGLGTLDLANVSRINVAVYQVPAQAGNGGQRASGVLYLAKTNFISLTSTGVTNGILVGWNDNTGNGNSAGVPNAGDVPSALYLGQTNSIFTDAIYVGTDKTLGCLLAFNPNGLNNPVAYFRGVGGPNSRVSLWGIGDTSMKSNSNQSASGTNDLTGGTVDILADRMNIGVSETGNSGNVTGNGTGVLTFDDGTIDVNTLTNGWSVGTGTNISDCGSGSVNVNDTAVLRVNKTFAFAQNTSTGTGVPVGTLNINDGTVLATNLLGGAGISTINLNSGELNVLGADPAAGRIAGISTLNIGSPSVGDTALLADAATITVANAITIAPNGVLAGNTVITAPGLTVNGTLSPGINGAGWMTNNGPVFLGAGGNYVVTVQDALDGPANGWSFLSVKNGINVQANSAGPFTISLQTGTGLATNFAYTTNYDWTIATAASGLTNFSANAFTVDPSLFANDLAGGYFLVKMNGNSLVLSITNNHPPYAGSTAVYRTSIVTTIPISTLTNLWSDPDGDPVALASINSSSAAGTNNVGTDGVYIYYTNSANVADAITYSVQDIRTNPPAVYQPGDTIQTATGLISVLPPPAIGAPAFQSGNLIFSGSGGRPGGTYYLLSSTNLTLPTTLWTIDTTNAYDANGNFNVTNPEDPTVPQTFYLLKLQ